jgi:CheY-like chemotaxis protein
VGNAIKFSPRGSVVNFAVDTVRETRPDGCSDDFVRLRVKDYGEGIAKEHLETIFEPFKQARLDIERKYGGTGLGLAITAKLVQALGGKISVQSEQKRWTEFTVKIKYNPAVTTVAQENVRVSSTSDVECLQNKKVLIAEDNLVNQKVLSRMLDRLGVNQVSIVENGKLAVDRVATEDYDVVLMDIDMPVMDGLEATRLITQQHEVRAPPIIFVTAQAIGSFRQQAYDAGGSGFVTKPFKLEQIKEMLSQVFRT